MVALDRVEHIEAARIASDVHPLDVSGGFEDYRDSEPI